MNNFLITAKLFFKTYKWILLLLIPLFFFVSLIFLIYFSPTTPQQKTQITPSPTPYSFYPSLYPTVPKSPEEESNTPGSEILTDLEKQPGFIKKETITDGAIIYSFVSQNPTRPDLVITTATQEPIFTRRLSSTNVPGATIAVYQRAYGEPDQVIKGSKIYGSNAATYVYSRVGLAFIADQLSGNVYEEHLFSRMSVTEYMRQFGNQN